jgi:hypothetical protein
VRRGRVVRNALLVLGECSMGRVGGFRKLEAGSRVVVVLCCGEVEE